MATHTTTAAIDERKLEALLGQLVTDMGAGLNGVLVMIGADLGLWKTLQGAGPLTAAELAARSSVRERYVREWAASQAASGYLDYHPDDDAFELTPEQATALADEDSPVYMTGGFHLLSASYKDRPKLVERFRAGDGFGWHEHDPEQFIGTEQFFRPGYRAHVIADWIPALEDVENKLRRGAKVADVGCGHGISTALIANAYPQSTVYGFDYHDASIERARRIADEHGAAANTELAVASAKDFPGSGYDLVCFFDCLHDMGDPVGALRHTRQALADDGTVMLVEPLARDSLAENLNPVGRIYYAASTVMCVPSSLDQEVGLGLGAQAGDRRLREVAEEAGFTRFRRATETPFNVVLELRP